jgi:hypothetical protein
VTMSGTVKEGEIQPDYTASCISLKCHTNYSVLSESGNISSRLGYRN